MAYRDCIVGAKHKNGADVRRSVYFVETKRFLVHWAEVSWLVLIFQSAVAYGLPQQAVSKLNSPVFREREKGQSELLDWGTNCPDTAKKELLNQTRTSQDPEVRVRCMGVLRNLVIQDYLKEGSGYIGVGLMGEMMKIPQDPKLRSVIRITQVQPKTPASSAGILVGDFIVGLDKEIWYGPEAYSSFLNTIKGKKPQTKTTLHILRGGIIVEVMVTLMRRPIALENSFLFNQQRIDLEGPERAAKEEYFRRWLNDRNYLK